MACQDIPIQVVIVEPDIDTVIQTYDSIKIYRSTSGEGGPYIEISTAITRPTLAAGVTQYTFDDGTGSQEYFYRYSYFHSDTLAESSQSDPERGEPDPALQVISVNDLKTFYLFGLDLTNDEGTPYPDSLYAFFIKSAVSWLEHKLDIPIIPKTFYQEAHDYYREDYENFLWVETDFFPVIGIDEIRLVLPGEQVVQIFEQDWIHLMRESGHVQLVPGPGSAGSVLFGAGGTWLPLIYTHNRFVPRAFRISYTAGFGYGTPSQVSPRDPMLDTFPQIIKELVGKIASFGPLNIAGDLLGGAGIASQSISIDGLAQNFNTTSSSTSAGYGARLIQYRQEIKDQVPTLQRYYKGLRLRAA